MAEQAHAATVRCSQYNIRLVRAGHTEQGYRHNNDL